MGLFRRKKKNAEDHPIEADYPAQNMESTTRKGNTVVSSQTYGEHLPSYAKETEVYDPRNNPDDESRSQTYFGSTEHLFVSPDSKGTDNANVSRISITNDKERENKTKKMERKKLRDTIVLKEAPSANNAAFGGPPRYDWIDVETSAAIKVQAAFRRNQALRELGEMGLSTAAMRNKERARNAKKTTQKTGEDVPGAFALCGIGLLFGDTSGEDEETRRLKEKDGFEQRRVAELQKEERLRQFRMRQKESNYLKESYEVVEDVNKYY